MKIEIQPDGIWYHGSNQIFSELRVNSTITQWKELAEAFSHQPSCLGYDDNGVICHNGTEKGYLYIIDEPVKQTYQPQPKRSSQLDDLLNKIREEEQNDS